MDSETSTTPDTTAREITVSRVIKAHRNIVFDAFLDSDTITEWWGPHGFTTTTHEQERALGGEWRFTMHGPDGTDYPNRVIYTEITRPELLRYDHDTGIDDDPSGFKVTITFTDRGNKTEVTLRCLFATAEEANAKKKFGAVEGGNQTLQRLSEFLAKQ